MTDPELELFRAFLRPAATYLEFGTGGSTYVAATLVRQRILSVDSSEAWLARVAEACGRPECRVRPELVFADIGPVARWGRPADESRRYLWPGYHEAVWTHDGAAAVDFCLVDGRFRVACFVQAALRLRPGTPIAVHDFNRRNYHPVCELARIVAVAETLAVLLPHPGLDRNRAGAILAAFRENPD